jgi:sugar lactone lactonase YvrE
MDLPNSIAFNSRGGFFVSDANGHRIVYFNGSSDYGEYQIGQADWTSSWQNYCNGCASTPTNYSLNEPTGMAIDANDNLYVCDTMNHRVLRFPPGSTVADKVYGQADFTTGLANRNGGTTSAQNGLSQPRGIAVDSLRNLLYISDTDNSRVLRWHIQALEAQGVYNDGGSYTVANSASCASGTGTPCDEGIAIFCLCSI